ncbi:hypothetical protein P8452_73922 [Trifolium repens]|nr:hypothetical protein P8452_73922 [Trifolium repens]
MSNRRGNKTLPVGEPSQGGRPTKRLQVPMVDFAENDKVVIEISSSAFVEAVTNARRIRRSIGDNLNMENQTMPTYFMQDRNQIIQQIDGIYINLEEDTSEVIGNATKSLETNKKNPELKNKAPESPKEPSIIWPICIGPFVEETTTRCGHIFCKNCIKSALTARRICPVKVYLPSLIEESSSDGEEN